MEKENKIDSYLTFKLGRETFAGHIKNVMNILENREITQVPDTPSYMKGVINLRGSVLPVIDLKEKLGMKLTEYTNNTCILVLNILSENEDVNVGAIVDAVIQVKEVKSENVLPYPSISNKYKSEIIPGVFKVNDDFIMILDLDKVFSNIETSIFKDETNIKNLK
ncbi:MAG: chemotaxis protein CheW [Bacteroidota bacterium]|nr:chemotaxis protein CheW [Bacteroidota bacterium]